MCGTRLSSKERSSREVSTAVFFIVSIFVMLGQVQVAALADEHRENKHNFPDPTRRSETLQSSENDGQHRDLIPLDDAQIKKALIGKRLTVDRALDGMPNRTNQGFSESFFPDGRWEITKNMFLILTETGRWRIRDGQICTLVTQSPLKTWRQQLCRKVWRDKLYGEIAMPEDSKRHVVLIFYATALNERQE